MGHMKQIVAISAVIAMSLGAAACGSSAGHVGEPVSHTISLAGGKCGPRQLIVANGTYTVALGQVVQIRLIEREGLTDFAGTMHKFPWKAATTAQSSVLHPIPACVEGISSLTNKAYDFRVAKHGTAYVTAGLTSEWQSLTGDHGAPQAFKATVRVERNHAAKACGWSVSPPESLHGRARHEWIEREIEKQCPGTSGSSTVELQPSKDGPDSEVVSAAHPE